MRNEVVILKYKADTAVSVIIPITVAELFCRFTADIQVALVIAVKTADDIKKRCFTAA